MHLLIENAVGQWTLPYSCKINQTKKEEDEYKEAPNILQLADSERTPCTNPHLKEEKEAKKIINERPI